MELLSSHQVQRFPVALQDFRHGRTAYDMPPRQRQGRPLSQRTMRLIIPPSVRLDYLEKGKLIDLYA